MYNVHDVSTHTSDRKIISHATELANILNWIQILTTIEMLRSYKTSFPLTHVQEFRYIFTCKCHKWNAIWKQNQNSEFKNSTVTFLRNEMEWTTEQLQVQLLSFNHDSIDANYHTTIGVAVKFINNKQWEELVPTVQVPVFFSSNRMIVYLSIFVVLRCLRTYRIICFSILVGVF